jgi:hypothetical protein
MCMICMKKQNEGHDVVVGCIIIQMETWMNMPLASLNSTCISITIIQELVLCGYSTCCCDHLDDLTLILSSFAPRGKKWIIRCSLKCCRSPPIHTCNSFESLACAKMSIWNETNKSSSWRERERDRERERGRPLNRVFLSVLRLQTGKAPLCCICNCEALNSQVV